MNVRIARLYGDTMSLAWFLVLGAVVAVLTLTLLLGRPLVGSAQDVASLRPGR